MQIAIERSSWAVVLVPATGSGTTYRLIVPEPGVLSLLSHIDTVAFANEVVARTNRIANNFFIFLPPKSKNSPTTIIVLTLSL
jgi:hypothetical protein